MATGAYAPLTQAVGHPFRHSDQYLDVTQSLTPLVGGALDITFTKEIDERTCESTYEVLRKLSHHWTGGNPPLVRGFYYLERRDATTVIRQAIPYTRGRTDQFQVMWNLLVPSIMNIGRSQLLGSQDALEAALSANLEAVVSSSEKGTHKSDFICTKPDQVAKQLIFEGKYVWVMANFKEVSDVDILIAPKEHGETIAKITKLAFVEAMMIGNAIVNHLKPHYPISYQNFAHGAAAGQTVPHWHLHVELTANKLREVWGLTRIAGNMVGLVKALPDSDFAKNIRDYQGNTSPKSLAPVIAHYGLSNKKQD